MIYKTFVIVCPNCHTLHNLLVNAEGFKKWQSGELIQKALPELSGDEREMLITGICGSCWNELFSEPDDPSDEQHLEQT